MSRGVEWFREARYGLFIHYGIYSLLGRGEWVLNRERIPLPQYRKLADRFTAERFDADALIRRAKDWGMRYAVLTCKHHDGFCLYDSKLSDFTVMRSAARRDLVREFVEACRKHGFGIGLYHSLNDWSASPSATDALERPETCYAKYIEYVHGQIREIMTNYGPVDIMWYDGWWPFDGEGWQGEKLNAMVRSLQPGIVVNGRCGVRGDFDTPEHHVSASGEGRPWEACVTVNENWGFHAGDDNWKRPKDVAEMLRQCAAGCGNLLLNVGPRGDGDVPEACARVLDRVGEWLRANGESIFGTEPFFLDLHTRRPQDRAEFTPSGRFTASGEAFYWHVRSWPSELTLAGVECPVRQVTELASGRDLAFRQEGDCVIVHGAPRAMNTEMPVVLRFRTAGRPSLYLCGGLRTPKVAHCRYDPLPSDVPPIL